MFSNTRNYFPLRELRSKRRNTFLTVVCLGVVIITFFLAYAAFGTEHKFDPSLKQVIILFRHGERAPSHFYPSDPHASYPWPEGNGQLLNAGKLSTYKLGERLRKIYNGFIDEYYLAKELSVKSSYIARCQMSAMTLLAGLYPPVGSQIWNSDLIWQPIPVNPIPRETDNLLACKAPCKALTTEKSRSDAEINNSLTKEQKDLLHYLSNFTNKFINNIEDVEFLYATLKIENDHGLVLPAWTKSVFPEPMRTMAAMNLASYSRTEKLKRLQAGPLLKEWLLTLKNEPGKLHLYSGHDLTLVSVMHTLGLAPPSFLPEFGATLILEYHTDPVDPYVKAVYLNSSDTEEPLVLTLPNCGIHCSLSKFEQHVQPYLPQDWNTECEQI